jgi:hypothetical protein
VAVQADSYAKERDVLREEVGIKAAEVARLQARLARVDALEV